MYSPCLLDSRIPKVKGGRKLASSPRGNRGSTQDGNTGKQSTVHHYYYGAIQDQASTRRQRDTDLSSRAVTNSLSEVLVTHDEYRTFTGVQVDYLQVIKQRLLTWQLKQARQKVKHKVNYLC